MLFVLRASSPDGSYWKEFTVVPQFPEVIETWVDNGLDLRSCIFSIQQVGVHDPEPGYVRYTADEIAGKRGRTDWAAVAAMTDADIDAAIADDPDAAPILDDEWFESATVHQGVEAVVKGGG